MAFHPAFGPRFPMACLSPASDEPYSHAVDASQFARVLTSWHDFYLAVASASAALLGLLFVGVSINLASIAAAERVDLRTKADVAFSNLLYLLGIALIVLIPGIDPRSLAISFASVAALGLLRLVRRVGGLRGERTRLATQWSTVRRLAWTFAADLLLLVVARNVALTGDADWLFALLIVVFVLLIGAADVAWGLLVLERREAQ